MSLSSSKLKLIAVSVAALLPCLAINAAGMDAKGLESDFTKVAGKVGPAVVTVAMERTGTVMVFGPGQPFIQRPGPQLPPGQDPFEQFFKSYFGQLPQREFKQQGLGSGVIFDKRGYVLTNQHVVEGANKITVILPDSRAFPAKLLGEDKRRDIAVLKIEAQDLPVAELGDSDGLKPGQWAIAIGNPFGHIVRSPQPTVTVGVVSALHRSLPIANQAAERSYVNLIQTDAAINPGNSGGALCDLNGKVIGINVAMLGQGGGNVNIGFAIPINTVKSVLNELISGKTIAYGWIGVGAQNITPDMAQYFGLSSTAGAMIAAIDNTGPAARAGLKVGDIILKFNGEIVKNNQDLIDMINNSRPGDKAALDVIKDKKPSRVRVEIESRPEDRGAGVAAGPEVPAAKESGSEWRGGKVSPITDELARELNIQDRSGVVIVEMSSQGLMYNAGLRPGDVIREINRIQIRGADDFANVTRSLKGNALVRTDKGYYIVEEGK
jgi:serine protease Do